MCHLLTGFFSFPFERPPSPRSHHPVHNLVKKSCTQPGFKDCKEFSHWQNWHHPVHNLVKKSCTQPGFKDCKEFSHWQNWHHIVHNLVKKSRTQPINKDFKELSQWHHPVHNLVYKDCTVTLLSRVTETTTKFQPGCAQFVWWQKNYNVKKL